MSLIADAHRDIADGIARVENDGENLPLFHGLELEFRLDEVVRADDPPQIQFSVRLHRLFLLAHHSAHLRSNRIHGNRIKGLVALQRPVRAADINKKGQPYGCPFSQSD